MILDCFVIVAYFAIIVSIGLYKGRGSRTMEGFAVGDRNIPWWAVLASILAAEVSAATFLGAPGEGYEYRNYFYAQLAIGTILARLLVSIIFIKPYYDFRVISIYDFLRIRFGETTRNGASIVFLITRALASGTRLYVAAIVLVLAWEKIYDVHLTPVQAVWIYFGALLLLTVFTAIYTALGGIKAVVWTDFIQATLMFGALGFAIYELLHRIPGGWATVIQRTREVIPNPEDVAKLGKAAAMANARNTAAHALKFWNSGITPGAGFWPNVKNVLETEYTVWAAFIASTFTTMATHGTDQDMVQRMLTAKDHVRSRLSLILSGLIDLPLGLCFLTVGILLWAFYQKPGMADPFAYYIVHGLPPGVRGIVIAGLFATAMGSLSTALNALATSFTEDWYLPYINPGASPARVVRAARISTIFFSVALVLIGAATAYAKLVLDLRIIPIVLGIFGYTYGSLLGVFLAGMLTKTRGDNAGNILAMVIGFLAVAVLSGLHNSLWIIIRNNPSAVLWKPAWLPEIAFPWRIAFGSVITFMIAILFPTPRERQESARRHVENPA
ncbi:MAG TPA: sodium:solute symporter [Chthoniobacteraceae bacterium]|jgi:SSS family transporter|nr:sodium:solute symporter [Chthoniobacteraceae bacterium]